MTAMLPVFLPFLVVLLVLLFGMGRRRACPDCGEPLPRIQSPVTKTWRMWVEGGVTCPKCGCEADSAGRKVAVGTAPRLRSVVVGAAMLTVAIIPAVFLWILILQR